MFARPVQLVQAVGQWHVQSQEVARRNALLASAALAQRRRERDEVERFLASRAMTRSLPTPAPGRDTSTLKPSTTQGA